MRLHRIQTGAEPELLGAEILDDLAEMLATELIIIDADGAAAQITKELRWNAAYHHLARGL